MTPFTAEDSPPLTSENHSYARVSTTGQDLDAQLAALGVAGVKAERVFTDKLSGSAKTDLPGLVAMLDYARAGDTVVVTAIDCH